MKTKRRKEQGITLIALVVTIIVLLILAGVSISMIIGNDGIMTKAEKAKLMTEFAGYKETFDLYGANQVVNTEGKYIPGTLYANETRLEYNTKEGSEGNIYEVIPELEKSKYKEKFEVIRGELILNITDKKDEGLKEIAESVGIKVNPYIIIDGVLMSSDTNLLLMDETGTITIPNGVTAIGEGAFSNLEGLKRIIIPGNVKEIKQNAFRGNTTLEEVIMEEGVETIGKSAFQNCTNLKTVTMPDSITTIESYSFSNCTALINIQLSKNLTSIPSWSFSNCTALEQITLPENIEEIGESAFRNDYNLVTINIPAKTNTIGNNAFMGCKQLTNMENASSQYAFNGNIFYGVKDKTVIFIKPTTDSNIIIPEGIKKINAGVFSTCPNMVSVTLPSTLKTISNGIFQSVNQNLNEITFSGENENFFSEDGYLYNKEGTELIYVVPAKTSITIKETVKTIKSFAIINKNITELTIPDNVEKIEGQSIQATKLQKLVIGKGVVDLSPQFKSYSHLNNLTVTIDVQNSSYKVEGNFIVTKDGKTLVTYISEQDTFNVPTGIEVIGNSAFSSARVSQIIFPQTLKTIQKNILIDTSYITELSIPSSVESIGENAFLRCSNLHNIYIDKEEGSIEGAPWGAVEGLRAIKWKE